MTEIMCLDCGYTGEADTEDTGDGGLLHWCPQCESLYSIILDTDEEKGEQE